MSGKYSIANQPRDQRVIKPGNKKGAKPSDMTEILNGFGVDAFRTHVPAGWRCWWRVKLDLDSGWLQPRETMTQIE